MAFDSDLLHQRIGEFVVSFQWVEHRLREIGWLILDPHRREWPPQALREEGNYSLTNKVEQLYATAIDELRVKDAEDRKENFRAICSAYHQMRTYRNRLLHSAFVELKGGGEVFGVLRSDPRLQRDPHSGVLAPEGEFLSDTSIQVQIEKIAEIGIAINQHYIQLIHWLPTPTPSGAKLLVQDGE